VLIFIDISHSDHQKFIIYNITIKYLLMKSASKSKITNSRTSCGPVFEISVLTSHGQEPYPLLWHESGSARDKIPQGGISESLNCSVIFIVYIIYIRFQWPRRIRRGSTGARVLGFRVRSPLVAWNFVVSVVCCQVEVSASG